MKKRDLSAALLEDLEQIEDNAELFRAGRSSAYQAVAIQLRNILLGGRRSLVARVLPQATFHCLAPARESTIPRDPQARVTFEFHARGSLRLSTRAPAELLLDFSDEAPPLTPEEWLAQWVLSPDLTIGALIRETANEEVAHTQDEIGRVVDSASAWELRWPGGSQRMHQLAIVALGRYVASRIRELLAHNDG